MGKAIGAEKRGLGPGMLRTTDLSHTHKTNKTMCYLPAATFLSSSGMKLWLIT